MSLLSCILFNYDIERLQCHPGKSGGHVFWCLQFCYRMFPICNRLFTTCNRTRDTKKHGRRSSRDDTATSLYAVCQFKTIFPFNRTKSGITNRCVIESAWSHAFRGGSRNLGRGGHRKGVGAGGGCAPSRAKRGSF